MGSHTDLRWLDHFGRWRLSGLDLVSCRIVVLTCKRRCHAKKAGRTKRTPCSGQCHVDHQRDDAGFFDRHTLFQSVLFGAHFAVDGNDPPAVFVQRHLWTEADMAPGKCRHAAAIRGSGCRRHCYTLLQLVALCGRSKVFASQRTALRPGSSLLHLRKTRTEKTCFHRCRNRHLCDFHPASNCRRLSARFRQIESVKCLWLADLPTIPSLSQLKEIA